MTTDGIVVHSVAFKSSERCVVQNRTSCGSKMQSILAMRMQPTVPTSLSDTVFVSLRQDHVHHTLQLLKEAKLFDLW